MRDGFAFSCSFKVRYAEIDGQKVVFNSRYLEYADAAVSEFWPWTGIEKALGAAWTETEFHVRHTTIDYLKPFVLGDTVEAFIKLGRIGTSSLTQLFHLCHAETGELHAVIEMVIVNVHLPTGKPAALSDEVRAFLETLL
ncbi:thioesterase family protein [Sphingomonas bacterium]|uniref:acyl-CoA thioesterase n=1 Tax=Sphingomonas bacterium TaxID=1895847 RepID=UPI0026061773|nr:thioesterase family protein [Sphingomonas bacterium]MDB5677339.1 4-hydroxybenzoyl-CoA thioesterase [Sphingomonas bacterium]